MTAFAATRINECVLGEFKVGVYKIALSDSMPASGEALGTTLNTDGWTAIYGMSVGCAPAVTDHGVKFGLAGTYSTTYKGYTASTVKLVAHQSAGSNAVFDEANAVNLSSNTTMTIVLFGK